MPPARKAMRGKAAKFIKRIPERTEKLYKKLMGGAYREPDDVRKTFQLLPRPENRTKPRKKFGRTRTEEGYFLPPRIPKTIIIPPEPNHLASCTWDQLDNPTEEIDPRFLPDHFRALKKEIYQEAPFPIFGPPASKWKMGKRIHLALGPGKMGKRHVNRMLRKGIPGPDIRQEFNLLSKKYFKPHVRLRVLAWGLKRRRDAVVWRIKQPSLWRLMMIVCRFHYKLGALSEKRKKELGGRRLRKREKRVLRGHKKRRVLNGFVTPQMLYHVAEMFMDERKHSSPLELIPKLVIKCRKMRIAILHGPNIPVHRTINFTPKRMLPKPPPRAKLVMAMLKDANMKRTGRTKKKPLRT